MGRGLQGLGLQGLHGFCGGGGGGGLSPPSSRPNFTSIASCPIFTTHLIGKKTSCLLHLNPRQPVTVNPCTLFSGKVKEMSHTLPICLPSTRFITSFFFSSEKVCSIFIIICRARRKGYTNAANCAVIRKYSINSERSPWADFLQSRAKPQFCRARGRTRRCIKVRTPPKSNSRCKKYRCAAK